jgi:hypothetical protein
MAQLRVFLSSTAYDLHLVRGHLRSFLESLGHQAVLSDYSDILYDPSHHTQLSCVQELKSCDAVVLIIGSRLGSSALPEFVEEIKAFDSADETISAEALAKLKVSVTQLEALNAFQHNIPVFAFVDAGVMSDLRVYESNLDSETADLITYPSIPDKDAAKYIFRFIKYIQERSTGNAVFSFGKISDIESTLARQWSALLQRLLSTERVGQQQVSLLDEISEQITDLKSAVLTSISEPEVREVARGVILYRYLIDFLIGIGAPLSHILSPNPPGWQDFFKLADIEGVYVRRSDSNKTSFAPRRVILRFKDGRFAEVRTSLDRFINLESDWSSFSAMSPESRKLVFDTLQEQSRGINSFRLVRQRSDGRDPMGTPDLDDYHEVFLDGKLSPVVRDLSHSGD